MTITVINARAESLPLDVLAACDVQIVDPPYSPYVHGHAMSCHSVDTGGPATRDLDFDPLSPTLMRRIAVAAAAVARWTIVFCDLESTHLWREEMARLGVEYVREIMWPDGVLDAMPQRWIRWSQSQISGDRPPSGAEATLTFHRGKGVTRAGHVVPQKKHWNGPGNLTHWDAKCLRGADKGTAEKPLDLALAIVSAYSDPGETVLVTCAGWGTEVQACRLLGRDCVAVEVDPVTCALAQTRIDAPLSERDRERATRWVDATLTETASDSHVSEPARARATRRLADARTVMAAVS
jgi:hypothetical protein